MAKTHIMVDLETWGVTPGSDIRSIGAVVFDPVAGTLGEEFYSVTSGGDVFGLTKDPSTVEWWAQQSEKAQAALEGFYPISLALADFERFWSAHGGVDATFWAHGPHFDEQILAACYRACGFPRLPWHYRAPRDLRTIAEAAGGVAVPFIGEQHDALDDAKHQACVVIAAYRALGLDGERNTPDRIAERLAAETAVIHGANLDHDAIMRRAQELVRS